MKLKFLFFFLALLLTAVWTILLVLTLKERGALFYIGEGVHYIQSCVSGLFLSQSRETA